MKATKILIWLILPVMLDTLIACCGCDTPQYFRYTNSSLRIEHLDNRGSSPIIATEAALSKAYGIRMHILCETTAKTAPSSFFLNKAYAFRCECAEPMQYHPKDSIIAMRIVVLDDFDNQPAGTDISSYFKLKLQHSFKNFEEYLHQSATVFYTTDAKSLELDAFLITPIPNGTYRFRVELDLSDGRNLIRDTSPITLQ